MLDNLSIYPPEQYHIALASGSSNGFLSKASITRFRFYASISVKQFRLVSITKACELLLAIGPETIFFKLPSDVKKIVPNILSKY